MALLTVICKQRIGTYKSREFRAYIKPISQVVGEYLFMRVRTHYQGGEAFGLIFLVFLFPRESLFNVTLYSNAKF